MDRRQRRRSPRLRCLLLEQDDDFLELLAAALLNDRNEPSLSALGCTCKALYVPLSFTLMDRSLSEMTRTNARVLTVATAEVAKFARVAVTADEEDLRRDMTSLIDESKSILQDISQKVKGISATAMGMAILNAKQRSFFLLPRDYVRRYVPSVKPRPPSAASYRQIRMLAGSRRTVRNLLTNTKECESLIDRAARSGERLLALGHTHL